MPCTRHAAACERQRDAAGADAELERRPVTGQVREEVDDGIDGGGSNMSASDVVVPRGHALAEIVLGHA